jgi:HEXXH motif-containing protein
MSASLPDGARLVLPAEGDDSLERLRIAYLKRTTHLLFEQLPELPGAAAELRSALGARVRLALAKDAKATLACLATPTIGAPLHCFANRASWSRYSDRIVRAFADSAPTLLLELASRGLLAEGETFDWTAGAPNLSSPSLGVSIHAPREATGWRFQPGLLSAIVPGGDGPSLRLGASSLARGRLPVRGLRSELAYVPLPGRIRLALVDVNPIAEMEAHPDKSGNALDLGGHSEDDWRESLQTALEWIQDRMPALFAEMDSVLTQVVPVGWHAQRHLSASYREAIGTIYMTLHPNPLTMAEALIHEFQHNKANIASYSDGLLLNAFHPLYKSPVRPDPRPLWGVLLAVHAFLPVACFFRALREAGHPVSKTGDFERRLDDIDLKNHEGMEVLRAHAQTTPFGGQMLAALDELDRRHMSERAAKGLATLPTEAHP